MSYEVVVRDYEKPQDFQAKVYFDCSFVSRSTDIGDGYKWRASADNNTLTTVTTGGVEGSLQYPTGPVDIRLKLTDGSFSVIVLSAMFDRIGLANTSGSGNMGVAFHAGKQPGNNGQNARRISWQLTSKG
jgi:hypothetical protein